MTIEPQNLNMAPPAEDSKGLKNFWSNMVDFNRKVYRTFVPKTRQSIDVKSNRVAPIQRNSTDSELKKEDFENENTFEIHDAYYDDYSTVIDRALPVLVDWSGSFAAFVLLVIVLIVWVVIGIVYNAPQNWQIVMQDGQSIQSYLWDTLLMRQQLDDASKLLKLYGRFKLRGVTHKRILAKINQLKDGEPKEPKEESDETKEQEAIETKEQDVVDVQEIESELAKVAEAELQLKPELIYQRFCDVFSSILGSLPAVVIFWIGSFVWVGCGALKIRTGNTPPYSASNPEYGQWSNTWQMYINTATAVELLITTVMLNNVRSQNNQYVIDQIEKLVVTDCEIESLGRYITNDEQDNEMVTVAALERKGLRKWISVYAEIIGTGIGVLVTIVVFVTWVCVGHLMQYNSNWWLIIGTYTGLVGFIDGFTLREVFQLITLYEQDKYLDLLEESQELLRLAGIEHHLQTPQPKYSIGLAFSTWMNNVLLSRYAVLGSIITVVSLISIATGMMWSETAQLVANTPTMIVEGFCLLILIQAHGWADYKRRWAVKELAVSRALLRDHLRELI